MLQPDESKNFSKHFYHHEPREALILDERMDMTIKNKPIVECILTEEEQLTKLNLGNKQNPKMVLIDAILLSKFVKEVEMLVQTLLQDYKDLFAWSYKELKRFPRQICESNWTDG